MARLEPVVFQKHWNRLEDINPPQYSPEKERQRDGRAGFSRTNRPMRVPSNRYRRWKLEFDNLPNRISSPNGGVG